MNRRCYIPRPRINQLELPCFLFFYKWLFFLKKILLPLFQNSCHSYFSMHLILIHLYLYFSKRCFGLYFSSDSDDETLLLVNLLTLNIEARRLHQRRSGLPRCVIRRDHFAGENLIHHHYFGPNPVYPSHVFRRRYAHHVILRGYDNSIVFTTILCSFL
jgi:hypothetical protein